MKRTLKLFALVCAAGTILGCGGIGYNRELRFFPGSRLAPIPKGVYARMDVLDGKTNYVWCTSAGRDKDEVVIVNMPDILRRLNPKDYWEYDYGGASEGERR
jgi:hypothetical protein